MFQEGRFVTSDIHVQDGTTVSDVACLLSIPPREIGIILINSRHALLSTRLAPQDCLALFPVIGGG